MVRVAVVGLGFMGKTHLGVYQELDNVQVTSICEMSDAKLNISSLESGGNIKTPLSGIDLSGIRKYVDYSKMLADGGFDFVDICLPTFLHVDSTIMALEAGYHVFLEKPMALNIQGTDTILQKIRETGRFLGVGHCIRYWPAYAEIKKMVDEKRYGNVLSAEFSRFSSRPRWAWDNWIIKGDKSGNAGLDLHIHDVDMVLYLFGTPKSLRSEGVFEKDDSIAYITTVYGYDDLVVNSAGGWICSDSYGFTMRAFCCMEEATIELDFRKDPILSVYPQGREKFSPNLPKQDGYYYELKDFAESIELGRQSGIVSPETAAVSVKLCLDEIASAREHREIVL